MCWVVIWKKSSADLTIKDRLDLSLMAKDPEPSLKWMDHLVDKEEESNSFKQWNRFITTKTDGDRDDFIRFSSWLVVWSTGDAIVYE